MNPLKLQESPDPKLAVEHVSLAYSAVRGGDPFEVLSDVSFSLGAGQSVCIIGPSGCGKSSLLRLICGLTRPTTGEIVVDGTPLAGPRQATGLILQDFGLLPWKNVLANAELGCKVRHMDRTTRHERAMGALEMVGLTGFERAYPHELSGGMKQRLAIARSLALDVDLLLMDEPLSSLDTLLREQMQELLYGLWDEGSYAQVLVTHSIEEAVFLGERIYVMSPRPGRIVHVVENPEMTEEDYRSRSLFHERCDAIRDLLRRGTVCAEHDGGEGSHE